jgi:hypothetical protein
MKSGSNKSKLMKRSNSWTTSSQITQNASKFGKKIFKNIREHRKYFVLKTKNYQKELDSINFVLSMDNKNYHAWAYRVWL